MTNAIITVLSKQFVQGEKNETEIMTEGTFEFISDRCFVVKYKENEDNGYVGAQTTIKVCDGEKLEMLREGSVSSELIIEIGKKNFCHYGTPYGEMIVGTQAKNVKASANLFGSEANVSYVLDVNSVLVGEYEIEISVKMK